MYSGIYENQALLKRVALIELESLKIETYSGIYENQALLKRAALIELESLKYENVFRDLRKSSALKTCRSY